MPLNQEASPPRPGLKEEGSGGECSTDGGQVWCSGPATVQLVSSGVPSGGCLLEQKRTGAAAGRSKGTPRVGGLMVKAADGSLHAGQLLKARAFGGCACP